MSEPHAVFIVNRFTRNRNILCLFAACYVNELETCSILSRTRRQDDKGSQHSFVHLQYEENLKLQVGDDILNYAIFIYVSYGEYRTQFAIDNNTVYISIIILYNV